jgi:hypothetical protein
MSLTIGFSLVCRHRGPVTERPTIGLTLTNRPTVCRLNLMTMEPEASTAKTGDRSGGPGPRGRATDGAAAVQHTLARDGFSDNDAQARSCRAYRARA